MVETRDLGPDDAPALTDLYGEYGWWTEREVDGVRPALAETAVAVGVEDDGELVAAARVFTDYTYYATVFDVVVTADRRREGLGRELMAAVRDHPDLRDRGRDGSRDRSGDGSDSHSLPGLSLLCREGIVPFYEPVGFERFDPEMEVPEGGTERLVRMTLAYDHEGSGD
jgi:GNAT superfamily N-acetyltransferase